MGKKPNGSGPRAKPVSLEGDAPGSQSDALRNQCHGLRREGEALPPTGRRASTCNPDGVDEKVKAVDRPSEPMGFMDEALRPEVHAPGILCAAPPRGRGLRVEGLRP